MVAWSHRVRLIGAGVGERHRGSGDWKQLCIERIEREAASADDDDARTHHQL